MSNSQSAPAKFKTSKNVPTGPASTRKAAKKVPSTVTRGKIVIRRLPPDIPEAIFWKSIDTALGDDVDAVDIRAFVPGKVRNSKVKANLHSRAYVHFKDMDKLTAFHNAYDGHIFRDSKGNQSQAVVEFAPYQKLHLPSKKPDPRQGSIEEGMALPACHTAVPCLTFGPIDPDYSAFIENLNKTPTSDPAPTQAQPESIGILISATPAPSSSSLASKTTSKTTPLLEHLRSQKAAADAAKNKPVPTAIQQKPPAEKVEQKLAQKPALKVLEKPDRPPHLNKGVGKKGKGKEAVTERNANEATSRGKEPSAGKRVSTPEPSKPQKGNTQKQAPSSPARGPRNQKVNGDQPPAILARPDRPKADSSKVPSKPPPPSSLPPAPQPSSKPQTTDSAALRAPAGPTAPAAPSGSQTSASKVPTAPPAAKEEEKPAPRSRPPGRADTTGQRRALAAALGAIGGPPGRRTRGNGDKKVESGVEGEAGSSGTATSVEAATGTSTPSEGNARRKDRVGDRGEQETATDGPTT